MACPCATSSALTPALRPSRHFRQDGVSRPASGVATDAVDAGQVLFEHIPEAIRGLPTEPNILPHGRFDLVELFRSMSTRSRRMSRGWYWRSRDRMSAPRGHARIGRYAGAVGHTMTAGGSRGAWQNRELPPS